MDKVIINAANEIQKSFAVHMKYVRILRKYYFALKQEDKSNFLDLFIEIVVYPCLMVEKREYSVERTVAFIVKFLSFDDNNSASEFIPIRVKLINLLNSFSIADSKAVRFRSVQLISLLLNSFSEDIDIPEEFFTLIAKSMIKRSRDKVPKIRVLAVNAMTRLQNPEDENDEITLNLLFLLKSDTSKDVRKAALNHLAITKTSINAIVERTRDIKIDVRRFAYLILSQKVKIAWLSISQRNEIFHNGFNDREITVRESCEETLMSWFKELNHSPVALLEALSVDLFPETSLQALKKCLEKDSSDFIKNSLTELIEKKTAGISTDENNQVFSPAQALWWRTQIESDLSARFESSFIPTWHVWCSLLRVHTSNKDSFALEQLLHIGQFLASEVDNFGRDEMSKYIQSLLTNSNLGTNSSLIKACCLVLASLHYEPMEYLDVMYDVIEKVRNPTLLNSLQKATNDARIELNRYEISLNDVLKNSSNNKDEEELLKSAVDRLNLKYKSSLMIEEECWLRVLLIISVVLEDSCVDSLSKNSLVGRVSAMGEFVERLNVINDLILPALMNPTQSIRQAGIHTLSLICLFSKEKAKEHLLIFIQALKKDSNNIQMYALSSLFDFMLSFGSSWLQEVPDVLKESSNDGSNDVNEDPIELVVDSDPFEIIIEELAACINHNNGDLREIAAEGFSKLFFMGIIDSPVMMSRLLIAYHSPATENDFSLRQCLAVFFPAFVFGNIEHQIILEKAMIPTLVTLINAPKTSPLSTISATEIGALMTHLTSKDSLYGTDTSIINEEEESCHDRLALGICNEIVDNSYPTTVNKLFLKILNSLDITQSKVVVDSLYNISGSIKFKDRVCNNAITKFRKKLEDFSINFVNSVSNEPNLEETNLEPNLERTDTVTVNQISEINQAEKNTVSKSKKSRSKNSSSLSAKENESESTKEKEPLKEASMQTMSTSSKSKSKSRSTIRSRSRSKSNSKSKSRISNENSIPV